MAENEEPNFDKFEQELNLSPLDQDSMQMHEMFLSLQRAGFRERQALTLVAMIVSEANEDAIIFTSSTEDDFDDLDEDFDD